MALPKLPTINQDLLNQLRGLFYPKDNPIVLSTNGFVGFHSNDTPSENPPFPYRYLYLKGDGHFYYLDYEGNEYELIDSLISPLALIQESKLTASVASVTFSDIPQTFRNLFLYDQVRTDVVAEVDNMLIRPNADSGANYDYIQSVAQNAAVAVSAQRATASSFIGVTEGSSSRASNFSPTTIFIPGYATANEKWFFGESSAFGDVSADADLYSVTRKLRWRNTAAITSLVLVPNTGPNFVSGCIFQLFGAR